VPRADACPNDPNLGSLGAVCPLLDGSWLKGNELFARYTIQKGACPAIYEQSRVVHLYIGTRQNTVNNDCIQP
jgi:hypothetical protein